MSAITWTAEASGSSPLSSGALHIFARHIGLGLGLVLATAAAQAGLLLTVLMASSIIQF